ncbi:hypothetical protein [Xylophilus sp.]|uniref:hypothetical protein n=1 Tax=Xylophilus sp. TaxID=2653893 RepID=UPI002D7EF948|nr:hypothetical protein [Xylophilus sp.]
MGVLVEFDAQGNWGNTHVCDCEIEPRLAQLGLAWGQQEGAGICRTATRLAEAVDDPRLLYLRAGSGYVGVLCEAGEWVGWEGGASVSNDARSSLLAGPSSALPSLEEFLETMLELTGNTVDEED